MMAVMRGGTIRDEAFATGSLFLWREHFKILYLIVHRRHYIDKIDNQKKLEGVGLKLTWD